MARYRVTAELTYYTEQPNEDAVYQEADELTVFGGHVEDERVTVSTVLEMPEGN